MTISQSIGDTLTFRSLRLLFLQSIEKSWIDYFTLLPLTRWKRSSSRFFFVLENHSTPQIFFLPLDLKYFLQNGKSANSKNPSVRRFEDFFHSFGYLVDSKSFCLKIFVQASAAATIGCCCPCCKVKITPRWFRNSKIPNFSVFVWLKVCF